MKLFFHFVLSNFSNTYLLGPANGGNAVIIDPGVMDIPLLNLIEENDFYVKNILVTHNHRSHVAGIKTLTKIYNADIYSNRELPFKSKYFPINEGDILELDDLTVDVMNLPGHSSDSMVFKINNMLFTGDVLLAGSIDSELTNYYEQQLKKNIRQKIFSLDDDILIFPGHGAPTTVKVEKLFNPSLQDLE